MPVYGRERKLEQLLEETKAEAPSKTDDGEKEAVSKKRFHMPKLVLAALIVSAVMGILNLIAWKSTAFCDFYTAHIFPVWCETYGRLTSLLPFSFGELLLVIAVFGLPLSLVVLAVLVIALKKSRKRIARVFGYVYLWIFVFVLSVQTLNCFILYHCSSFAELNGISHGKYTHKQLEELGDALTVKLNELSTRVKRDSQGRFVLTADVNETARKAVEDLGEEFVNLDGFTVRPKPIYFSFFMSQMDLMGLYMPFSMEANYNNDMYKAKLPNTVCHELAHTKGYIREDEANFISFMACSRSDNTDYRYSGYLCAFLKVRGKIFDYASDEKQYEFDSRVSDLVWADVDANRQYWQSVEEAEDTVFDSETVGEIADKAMDTSLKMNGVSDGAESYGRMVDLMLGYYADKGEI